MMMMMMMKNYDDMLSRFHTIGLYQRVTDRQTELLSISRVSVLTLDKNRITKCLIWSVLGSTLCSRDLDADKSRQRLKAFEMWIWKRILKIRPTWMDKITNEKVLAQMRRDVEYFFSFFCLSAVALSTCLLNECE